MILVSLLLPSLLRWHLRSLRMWGVSCRSVGCPRIKVRHRFIGVLLAHMCRPARNQAVGDSKATGLLVLLGFVLLTKDLINLASADLQGDVGDIQPPCTQVESISDDLLFQVGDLGPPAARESLFAAFGVRHLHFVFSPSPDLDWFNAEILGYRLQGLSSELSGIGGEHHLDLIAIGEELPDHFETILTVKMSEKDVCLQRRLC